MGNICVYMYVIYEIYVGYPKGDIVFKKKNT